MILHAVESGQGAPVVLLHGLFGSARNFGAVRRGLAQRFRAIALDLRNHGTSPHAADMRYSTMAGDVLETLRSLDALPASVVGHSMGGKAAMAAALLQPEAVARLVVADIAPVAYEHGNAGIACAMRALPLRPGMTRAEADAALGAAVPDSAVRGFLLQNLSLDGTPGWRIGLGEIAAAMRDIEGWEVPGGRSYSGPALFVAGGRSDYISAEDRPAIRALFPAARFVTLKKAGHWLHADDPAGFVAVLQAFLA
jgi:pimeloyl-ACP methyl ester carboxylesterase